MLSGSRCFQPRQHLVTSRSQVHNGNQIDPDMSMDPHDRDYSNDEITVHWRASSCIHATTCYRELIEVFNPRNRPWVNMKGATTEKIIEIVRRCPTEALTYDWKDPFRKSDKPGKSLVNKEELDLQRSVQPVSIKVMKDGPLVVEGNFRIIGSDGQVIDKLRITSFCRCGQSFNMPFCDGSHRKNSFTDDCD